MPQQQPKPPIFGYLEALEDPDHGVTGGYLILSCTGRPLEFHCTAPVRPSRAEEILFGVTLRPHLLGERIGATLVERAALRPVTLVVADADMRLAGASHPGGMVLIRPCPPAGVQKDSRGGADASASGDGRDRRRQSCGGEGWAPLDAASLPAMDAQALASPGADHAAIAAALIELAQSIDPAEPFERIREAIREAQRLSRSGAPGPAARDRDRPVASRWEGGPTLDAA